MSSARRLVAIVTGIALMGVTACGSNLTGGSGSTGHPATLETATTPTTTAQTERPSRPTVVDTHGRSLSSATEVTAPDIAGTADTADTAAVNCPAHTVSVNDPSSLTQALSAATPGTVIQLADGTYRGNFAATVPGTAQAPIWLCGGSGAVIDGGSTKDGYAFHLENAQHWRLVGFTITGAEKGLIVDHGTGIVIQGLTVSAVGHEAIHLRSGTTYSLVRDNIVFDTGLEKEKYGEGIYVGSASSNWCTYSACGPDRSNNNAIVDNHIRATSAESIDIKEGTQDGLIQGNTFDGSGGLTGADSWVDVKGNGWRITGNRGVNSPVDGFQVHSVEDGWGTGNVFDGNTAEVNGSGYGINLAPILDNTVTCDNQAIGAAAGLTNTTCT